MNHERILDSIVAARQIFHLAYQKHPKFLICSEQGYKILKNTVDKLSEEPPRGRLSKVLDMVVIVTTCYKDPSNVDAIDIKVCSTPIVTGGSEFQEVRITRADIV